MVRDVLLSPKCDAADPWQFGSQDAATPLMNGIMSLHHDICLFLLWILVFVSRIMVRAASAQPIHLLNRKQQWMVHGTTIEMVRTLFPSLIPMFIAIPSFALLYTMDELVDPNMTIKAIGHQWYRRCAYYRREVHLSPNDDWWFG